jgi:hypothetical protein
MFMRYLSLILLPFLGFAFSAAASAGMGDGLLVGFKGGVNFSVVIPTQRFSVIQSLGGTGTSPAEKEYGPFFRNTGYQYGFLGMIRVGKAFLVSIEPAFSSYIMKYQARSTWYNGSTPTDRIEITTKFTDRLRYFEIPLELRYEMGTGRIRPYLAAGFFYGMLTGAAGSAQSSTVQYINDVAINLENNTSAGDFCRSGLFYKPAQHRQRVGPIFEPTVGRQQLQCARQPEAGQPGDQYRGVVQDQQQFWEPGKWKG